MIKEESKKNKRREVFLSDEDIKVAHEKAALDLEKGNRNDAIRYCIRKAPKKK